MHIKENGIKIINRKHRLSYDSHTCYRTINFSINAVLCLNSLMCIAYIPPHFPMKVIQILTGRINKSISEHHDDSAYKIKVKVGIAAEQIKNSANRATYRRYCYLMTYLSF
jgi:hypothetical protein